MKKRLLSLTMAVMMAGTLLAGCSSQTAKTGDGNSADTKTADQSDRGDISKTMSDKPLKVVYLVNGSLGDKGFYDSAASGMQMMKDKLGAEIKIVEMGRDETSYEGHYLDVSEQDWDLIISGTWSVKEIAENTAVQFPEKQYIFFDGETDFGKVVDGNMMGVNYSANQGAFMAGCLAAKMLSFGDAKIDPSKKILGFVGSMDVTNINDFLIGYLDGIKYVDPEIKVMTSYVGSFEDVPKCLEMTTQLYNQGAQIIYAPVSQSNLGAVTAAANVDKYLITCDQDIYSQLKDENPDQAANIISSSLNNVGESLFTSVEGYLDGSMTTDKNYMLGLDSGAVGLAKNENYEKLVPEAVRKELDEIEKKVSDGEVKIGTAFDLSSEEIAAIRDAMKP